MVQKSASIRICDCCKKEVSDNGEMRFGGSAFDGWIHLNVVNGSTQLNELNKKSNFDFCSKECLLEWCTIWNTGEFY